LLEGNKINLRLVEPEQLPILVEWFNDVSFLGETRQDTRRDIEGYYNRPGYQWFFIEKKDGTKIGYIFHFPSLDHTEIGYAIIPTERRKGYCTEAVRILIDYLFLSKPIVRVHADAETVNIASQKVLEGAGFTKEGLLRKYYYRDGEWRDSFLYSILREEWNAPKILQISFGK
jgi:RimJ/RimL family protein N-acetyltransferase